MQKDLSADLQEIKGDPIRLEQVIIDLLTKVRDAVEASGKNERNTWIKTYSPESTKAVKIDVMDNGTGIAEQDRKKTIEEHQGSIEFESEQQKGATFSITLPVE